jgi:hypothetical protein
MPRDASSDNDRCRSEDEQHRANARRNIPWSEIERQAAPAGVGGKAFELDLQEVPTELNPQSAR